MAHTEEPGTRPTPHLALQPRTPIDRWNPGPGVVVLAPSGDLDMLTVPALHDQLRTDLRQHRHIIVDLSDILFLGSAGIQVLLEAHLAALEVGASLHVTGAGNPVVARPLHITTVDEIIDVTAEPAPAFAARLLDESGDAA
jgi:anti-sigma B factor antagonist